AESASSKLVPSPGTLAGLVATHGTPLRNGSEPDTARPGRRPWPPISTESTAKISPPPSAGRPQRRAIRPRQALLTRGAGWGLPRGVARPGTGGGTGRKYDSRLAWRPAQTSIRQRPGSTERPPPTTRQLTTRRARR